MKHEIYLNCKAILKETATTEKRHNPKDKARVREVLNNLCDELHRNINWHCMKGKYSEKTATLYCNWLSNYTCSLHP